MGYATQNFRDLLALARLPRRFAQENICDGQHELLLDTATALEARVFSLANNLTGPEQDAARAGESAGVIGVTSCRMRPLSREIVGFDPNQGELLGFVVVC